MSRAEHTYSGEDLTVQLIVPDGVTAPRWVEVMRGADVVRVRHSGVRNLRAPVKRKPRQERPLVKMTADWLPPADEVERARVSVPSVDVDFETAQFVDWALGKGEARADWVASWRRWLRETHKRNVEKGWRPRAVGPSSEAERLAMWCRDHGVTVEEFEARRGEPGWLDRIKRRGKVT